MKASDIQVQWRKSRKGNTYVVEADVRVLGGSVALMHDRCAEHVRDLLSKGLADHTPAADMDKHVPRDGLHGVRASHVDLCMSNNCECMYV